MSRVASSNPERVYGSDTRAASDEAALAPFIRILIADDTSLLRDGLVNLLAGQPDFEVLSAAGTPAEAGDAIRNGKPDIVLLGWPASAPGSQKIFGAIQEWKLPTRVIMLTNGDLKEDFAEAVRQGCCGIVQKRTSTELLLKSIRKVHSGEYWMDRMTTADVIRRLSRKAPVAHAVPSTRLGVRDQSSALSQREREIVVLVARRSRCAHPR